jgi:hypothetical protein
MTIAVWICVTLAARPWASLSAREQPPTPKHGLSLATSEELQAKIGTEAESRSIIQGAIAGHLSVRAHQELTGTSTI